MTGIKKFLFTAVFTLILVLLIALLFRPLGSTVISVIILFGIFAGRFLYTALFQVMINHKSIRINDEKNWIQFSFQIGISKHYIVIANFESNLPHDSLALYINDLIFRKASREKFKKLIDRKVLEELYISDESSFIRLLEPRIINI